MEDIKEPWIKSSKYRKPESKSPAYTGYQNYQPSIKFLMEKGILTKHAGSYRVSYAVNKENLTNFLQTIK